MIRVEELELRLVLSLLNSAFGCSFAFKTHTIGLPFLVWYSTIILL